MNFYEFMKDEMEHTYQKSYHPIQEMLGDWWDSLLDQSKDLDIRDVVKIEVEKVIGCGSKENGFAFYECDDCSNYMYVPFTCKSRFCPSCGFNATLNRSNIMPSRCLDVPHRHVTFTMPDILWPLFRIDRSLLHELFLAASSTLLSWFLQQSKFEKYTPGIIASLHTFGRDLKWNPHIHILVTQGAMGRITKWKPFDSIPYKMLRKRFMTKLLLNLSIHFEKDDKFKKLTNQLYKQYDKGFYVNAKKRKFPNTLLAVAYVTRYSNKPAIAESRIIEYDGEYVSFWYKRHQDNNRVEEKVPVLDFIKRLIIHIPEKGFNTIRYYGIYAMRKSKTEHLKRIKEKPTKPLSWIDKLILHFKCNPLKCSCGNTLKFQFIVERKSYKYFQLHYQHLL